MRWLRSFTIIALAAALTVMSVPGAVYADYDARDYIAAPPGTNLMLWYYRYVTGHKYYSDGEKVSDDFNLTSHVGIFRYVRYVGIGSFTTYMQVIAPFGSVHVDGQGVGNKDLQSSGLGDVIPAAGIFLINNPESKTYLGFTEYVSVPTGEYENTKGVNFGTNRWGFKSELGFSKGFDFGDGWAGTGWNIDLGVAVELYTDNTDYTADSLTLEKDPLWTLDVHLSKDLTKNAFLSLDYNFHKGGETAVDGVDMKDETENHQLQLTAGYSLSPGYQLLIQYRTTLSEENGAASDLFGLRLMYAW
jgi:hypothetical protein